MSPPSARRSAARRLGVASGYIVLAVGVAYLGLIALWLVVERTPAEPIGDPWLATMEGLTMVSALAVEGLLVAICCRAGRDGKAAALGAVAFGTLTVGLTLAVHFVQLTAVRQLWRAGELADYRLVWPSPIFAVEYLAWDILLGLALVLAGAALDREEPTLTWPRRVLIGSGLLCLIGAAGPFTGWMPLQNVSLVGYGVGLPLAGGLTARHFARAAPSDP